MQNCYSNFVKSKQNPTKGFISVKGHLKPETQPIKEKMQESRLDTLSTISKVLQGDIIKHNRNSKDLMEAKRRILIQTAGFQQFPACTVRAKYTEKGENFSSTNSLQPSIIPFQGPHTRFQGFKFQNIMQYIEAFGFVPQHSS